MNRARLWPLGVSLALAAIFSHGCGEDSTQIDLLPPAVVEDFRALAQDSSLILLTWTAPGDDGDTGQAAAYDLRSSMDLADPWEQMDPVAGVPAPAAPGSPDSFLVDGLPAMETFHFRLSARDDAFNWSEPSELVSATTQQGIDRTPPGMVTSLEILRIEPSRILLGWKAPGDDGYRGRAWSYDARYWMPGVSSWDEAFMVVGEPSPARAHQPDSVWVEGLEPNTDYLFALRSRDEVENWSPISNIAAGKTAYAEDLNWSDGFELPPAGQGIVETVHAMIEYDGALIAGGLFNRAGEVSARNIAHWDGERWSALGNGTNAQISHMTVFEGDLIVSGPFTGAGTIPARGIARWNGGEWTALGDGTAGGPVEVWNGELIARIGDRPDTLGRWTGTVWAPLPASPLDHRLYDLEVYEGNLVAGGSGNMGDANVFVASFDGTTWTSLYERTGQWTDPKHVNELLADGGLLYIGEDGEGVRVWDGSALTALPVDFLPYGSEPDGVIGLAPYRGGVVALGDIMTVGRQYSPGIAWWNGSSWERLGSGLDLEREWVGHGFGPVGRAALEFDGALYVGGTFDMAGRKASRNIARWEE